MSKDNFDRLMHQLSDQAEIQHLEEERQKARAAKRQKVINGILTLIVAGLFAAAFYKHTEIQDTITKLFPAHETEYSAIKKLTRELKAQQAAQSGSATNDSVNNVVQAAREHAAAVDSAMSVK